MTDRPSSLAVILLLLPVPNLARSRNNKGKRLDLSAYWSQEAAQVSRHQVDTTWGFRNMPGKGDIPLHCMTSLHFLRGSNPTTNSRNCTDFSSLHDSMHAYSADNHSWDAVKVLLWLVRAVPA